MSKPLLITIFFLLVSAVASAQVVRQETLESVRENIVFPELSLAEKRVMAEQAQLFLRDLYVHRFDKLAFYPGLTDPVPAIEQIVNNIDSLTTAEMEEAIYREFVAQRDLHLNYIFPSPHANFRSFLPLTFTRTAGKFNFFEVRVNSVNQALFEQFAPGQRVPEIGDRIIGYNGMSIRRAVRKQLATAQGANRFGGFSRALGQMTFVPHNLHLVPDENEIKLWLISSKNGRDLWGSLYSITLPWIAEWREAAAARRSLVEPAPRKLTPEDLTQGVDLWQQMYNDFVVQNGLEPRSAYPSNPSNEPTLTWGVIENGFGKFGYFNLSSFVPATGDDATLEEIRRIVNAEFQDTTGLIFDVRNNGGGSIILADKMSQLFMRDDAQVIKARLLNTDLNRQIFNDSIFGAFSNPQWTEVINEAEGTGNIYTELAPFTFDDQANELGQVYYKPVAVLANARSYSATDLFTCGMQDNIAALVYGEDPRTGAGGANVITHNLFNFVLPSVFEALPGDHAMRVSWRQSVRFGKSAGKIIEDFGCSANIDVSQTLNDIVSGGETQMRRITRSLAWRARADRYQASVRTLQNSRQLFLSRGDSYSFFVKNTEYINVVINGELFEQVPVFAGGQEEAFDFILPADLPGGVVNSVVFEGIDDHQRRLWNLKRQVIFLEDKVTVDAGGFEIDFATATGTAPFNILNQNPPEDGWNLVTPNLQIGYNPTYADNLDTDALLFLDLTGVATAQLSFDMEFDTEPGFDFIEVFVTDDQENRVSLLLQSGGAPLTTYEFDLSAFAGQDNVMVHFRFTSDTNTVAPGVRLQRVSIR
ncbi:S41 family peptidase [Exilibacterium tricleocarpae]|nr:S41 family peptidase [Exilibacterium tricleocarpae]